MKKLVVITLSIGLFSSVIAFAAGMRCMSCNGSGFSGNFNCAMCKGTGRNGSYTHNQ
jgi:DnaJ-class molecular chaperone